MSYEALGRVAAATVRVFAYSAWREGDGGLLGHYLRVRNALWSMAMAGDPARALDGLLDALGLTPEERERVDREELLDTILWILRGNTSDAVEALRTLIVDARLPLHAAADIIVAVDPEAIPPLRQELVDGLRAAERLTGTEPPSLEEVEARLARGSPDTLNQLIDALADLYHEVPFNPADLLDLPWELKDSLLPRAAVAIALARGYIVLDDITALEDLKPKATIAGNALRPVHNLFLDEDP